MSGHFDEFSLAHQPVRESSVREVLGFAEAHVGRVMGRELVGVPFPAERKGEGIAVRLLAVGPSPQRP